MKYIFLAFISLSFVSCATHKNKKDEILKKAEKDTMRILLGKTMSPPSAELKETFIKTDISKTKSDLLVTIETIKQQKEKVWDLSRVKNQITLQQVKKMLDLGVIKENTPKCQK